MAEKKAKIKGTASTSAVPAKPAKITSRDSFYNTNNYAPTNKAASSVNTSVKMTSANAQTPAAVGRMNALYRAIVTGTPIKSKNKNPGKYLDK